MSVTSFLVLLILGTGKIKFGKWQRWDFNPKSLSPTLRVWALNHCSWFLKLKKRPWIAIDLVCDTIIFLVLEFHINWILQYGVFCIWILLLSKMLLKFIHVEWVYKIVCSFFSSVKFHCMAIPQFVYSFKSWWKFGLFPVWALYE